MKQSFQRLRLKIVTGYVTLIALFFFVLIFVCHENHKLGTINEQATELLTQRQQTEEVIAQILDMSLLGEQMIVWDDEDLAKYFIKKDTVVSSLIKLKQQFYSEKQQMYINTILSLLDEKEVHIIAILNNLENLKGAYNIVQKRIPSIIKKSKEQQENLTKEVQENIENNRKRTSGLLNIFHSKKKSIELTDQDNKRALQNSQSRSEAMLRSLETEIELTRNVNSKQLVNNVDSLKIRNNFLNHEISRMVSELSQEDQKLRCNTTERYLRGQEKTVHVISITGLAALLLSIFFYWLLHRDLNEKHQNRIQLEQLNRKNEELLIARKNMMLAVSHDLRAPLNTISGYAELILEERKKEKRIRYSNAINQSAGRMLSLLNSLLDFYRLDTGKERIETVPFRLKNLFDLLMIEFTPLAKKKNLELNGEYQGDDVVVAGDKLRLMQIASNLLSNSAKFTSSGHIRIVIDYANETLTILVEDTGVGMTKEQTDRIFKPFERLPNAETEEGFGLGLSVTLALVSLLGGQIDVTSQLEKGSVFTVKIPLPTCNEENISQQNPLLEPDTLPDDLRIAVVDNDAIMLAMTTDMFSRQNVYCDGCRNAKELMDMMRMRNFDLVITDIMMPEINGFQLLELLRTSNIGNSRTVSVLAMTARAERSIDEFINAGFAGCLYKPFSRSELFAAVKNCIVEQATKDLPVADFSVVLSDEREIKKMLNLLIEETDKNMNVLIEAQEKNDRETISTLTHQLMPLWEIVRIDAPLKELQRTLSQSDTMDCQVHRAVQKVLSTGYLLMEQAKRIAEQNGYE
jgi:signal transduction histidine kinase/DNA-binding response OmpR family regulator